MHPVSPRPLLPPLQRWRGPAERRCIGRGRSPRRTPQRARLASAWVAASFLTLLALGPRPAGATTPPTFTVNSISDAPAEASDTDYTVCRTATVNTTCTLRAAIMKANRYAGGGVTINIPSGTYTLTIAPSGADDDSTGDLNITNTMTINGVSVARTIIDGNQIDRVFNEGVGITVIISNVTIRNGLLRDGGAGIENNGALTLNDCVISGNQTKVGTGTSGGGIINLSGTLTLNSTVVSGNTADGNGGGIYNDIFSTLVLNNSVVSGNQTTSGAYGGGIGNYGTLTINNSLVNDNETSPQAGNPGAGYGGGIAHFSGTLTMTNSTISANGAYGNGGGMYQEGTVQLFHVTVAGNIADLDSSGAGLGGGIFSVAGANGNHIGSSLVVENYAASQPNDCGGDPLTSEDYNYIQAPGCSITGTTTHNITGGDALLGELQNNGGPTQTRALLAGSPAIDQIPPALCRDPSGNAPFTDQRGVRRPVGPLCDIGAYEGEQPVVGYNRNLVCNGDAEAAAGSPSGALVGVPDWDPGVPQVSMTVVPYGAPGGFPSLATDTVPADHGFNFFAGGDSAVAVSIQDIDLSALGADIDAGIVSYHCSADLGGYLGQEDNATVEYDFLEVGNQAARLLWQVILGPVTAADRGGRTGLLHRDATGPVPPQTRIVEVYVTLTRAAGPDNVDNDGYADNIALVLTSGAASPCVGDCSGTHTVAINDLITLVNIALGKAGAATCPQGIPAGSAVNVALLIQAVNNALSGCSG